MTWPVAVDDGWAGLYEHDDQLPADPGDFDWDLAADVMPFPADPGR